jgi:hypothetical protein
MPEVLRTRGYRFFFFSREDQEPRHIHVEHSGKYAKYWLEPVELAENRGFRRHELTRVRQLVEEHRDEFIDAWDAHLGGEAGGGHC